MVSGILLLPFLLLVSQEASAQSTTAPSEDSGMEDIVVKGGIDPDEPDPSNLRRKMVTGSRIPQRSLQNNPHIASATSLGGLTSDSGMDAWQSIGTKRWKTCKAEGALIRKRIACALVRVEKAMTAMHAAEAGQIASSLASDPNLTVEEQYVVHAYLYRIADLQSDAAAKRRSLAAMFDTGMMSEAEERAAVGTLASWALKEGDSEAAVRWYRELASRDANDTQSRINAGILLGRMGKAEESRAQFQAAISAARREGKPVPAAWIERAN